MNLYSDPEVTVQSYIDTLLVELPAATVQPALKPFFKTEPPVPQRSQSGPSADGRALDDSAGEAQTRQSAFIKHLQAAQSSRQQWPAYGRNTQANAPVLDEALACLTFKVANLKLAVPKDCVHEMRPLPIHFERQDEIDGRQMHSLLGVLPVQELTGEQPGCDVVDTARLIMPERYNSAMTENYRFALLLKDMDWCLAVDSVAGETVFQSQSVRWRSAHTRREWLAGTVIDKMCAIVDIEAINRMLLAERVLDQHE